MRYLRPWDCEPKTSEEELQRPFQTKLIAVRDFFALLHMRTTVFLAHGLTQWA